MVTLSQIMFPIVVLLGLTGLVIGILQANGQFGPTAFVPVLWNAVILFFLVVVTPLVSQGDRIYVYAVGILVGTVAQLLWLLPYLRGRGPFPLSLGLRNPYVRRVLVLMLPVTIGLGLINVNASVDAVFATLVSTRAVRAIDAAFRLYILPQGIFSVAVSTVLFPTISRLAARGDTRACAGRSPTAAADLLHAAAGVGVPDGAERSRSCGSCSSTASSTRPAPRPPPSALLFFTLGLCFNGASLLLIRTFFSLKQPWMPTKVALGTLAVNAVLDVALLPALSGVGGIPLATSLASFAGFVALAWLWGANSAASTAPMVVDGLVRTGSLSVWLGPPVLDRWHVLDQALGRSLPAQIVSLGGARAAGDGRLRVGRVRDADARARA